VKGNRGWSAADRVIFADGQKNFFAPETAAYFFGFAVTCFTTTTGRPYDNHGATMMQIDQDLFATLYVLGFNFLGGDLFSGEIAEIKGDMTIKLVHPLGEELKCRVAG